MPKVEAKLLSFFVTSIDLHETTLLLSPCSVLSVGTLVDRANKILTHTDSETASGFREPLRSALAAGNVFCQGWSAARNKGQLELTFSAWDSFCLDKIGQKANPAGRGDKLTLERLIEEVKGLEAAKLVKVKGGYPGLKSKSSDDEKNVQKKKERTKKRRKILQSEEREVAVKPDEEQSVESAPDPEDEESMSEAPPRTRRRRKQNTGS